MSDDMVKRLREATFSRSTMRGGIIGQTIEAAMRSTFHEVSAYDLHEAAEIIESLTAERDRLRAAISHAMTELGQSAQDVHAIRAEAALSRALAQQEGAKGWSLS
jgi:uncharacterized protein (UPF0335 family)